MAKVDYFIGLTIFLTLLMKMTGIDYGGTQLLTWIGLDVNNFAVSTGYFAVAVAGLFIAGATIGLVASNREASLRAGLSSGMLLVGIGTFIGILQYVQSFNDAVNGAWVFNVVFLIFSVYIVSYIMALISFWGGTN